VRIVAGRTLRDVQQTPEDRLRRAFEQCSRRVFAYALRHTDPATAHDVVADVFLVAWRRIDDLPDPPLPWLLVVARNTIANTRRGTSRRRCLTDELAGLHRATATSPGAGDVAVERASMLAALAELTAAEREALLLVAWDGLTSAEAASVAGCSRRAFEVRLSRARARLDRDLRGQSQPSPSHLTQEVTA
jgi:RNA polymerase sigma factor (sigma-70 family)